ncbi:hypothetical protein ONZ45_g15388 [Pleurotus djamor]|nr:hypothetical protein ONZ45_g15388 [Pleurotus djamor]
MGFNVDALRQIIETGRLIQAKTKKPTLPAQSFITAPPTEATPIDFPPLPDVSLRLLSIGVAEEPTQKMVEIYLSKCSLLRTSITNWLQEVQPRSSPSVQPLLHTYAQKAYRDDVLRMESELYRMASIHHTNMQSRQSKPASKVVFNADFVPFLEKYFEYNAYPSAADRALMARKSLMTPRQIEVWFQNHRNRARKEGKCLPRLHPSDKLPDLRLAGLEEKMSDFIKSDPEKSGSDETSDCEDTELRNQVEELVSSLINRRCIFFTDFYSTL